MVDPALWSEGGKSKFTLEHRSYFNNNNKNNNNNNNSYFNQNDGYFNNHHHNKHFNYNNCLSHFISF